ncbi:GlxA family transcriptional regulator [Rhizorhabdus dicambivorans]|uniref:GlxA family transcriptional regulator n=1 Tax=Rhizorhabdus dicambivorans TaxID=1850238 RepID=A0A2A4G0J8_9SPHN|nr:GlxA family transcriptional regulator [Rhizorhabdus dicambivorans]ATE63113.1 GlxA family transcriptional regulator [Rhizorhabdus dicambivorans]PCE43289.1 GlxA family transcriptional regulator [Rhizorhabdus dicambivorans]
MPAELRHRSENPPVRTVGLLLTDGFALMSYASIVEPYRAANVLAGRELYRWRHISIDGNPVRASNGASILADQAVGEALSCDMLFVFAGGEPARFTHRPTFTWLRRIAAMGTTIAGISGGPFLMARAGLLDGYRATIHWDHMPSFMDSFRDLTIEPGLYVIDRRRVTCAGGTAGLDLAIEFIAREQGHALASQVSEWFIRTEARGADRPQRLNLRERYGVTDDRVVRALALMESSVEDPLTAGTLASSVGVSLRQLERLFATQLQTNIGRCYAAIRLEVAHDLLHKTGMSVTDVAVATGFRSGSYFARAYRSHFGEPPSATRRSR